MQDTNAPTLFAHHTTRSRGARVLHVDDAPGFAETSAEFLRREHGVESVHAETDARDALQWLNENPVDCVVSDYEMPEMDGLAFLEAVRENHPDLPFILFSGKGNEEIASEAISAGVTDYLQKVQSSKQYQTLAHRISNAVDQYRAHRRAEETHRQHRRLIQESTDVISVIDRDGVFRYLSPSVERILSYTPEALVGETFTTYVHPDDREMATEQFATVTDQTAQRRSAEFRVQNKDGTWVWLEVRWRDLLSDPSIEGIVLYARDVTERKEREQELQKSEHRFRSLFEEAFDPILVTTDSGRCVDANTAACDLFGRSSSDLLGKHLTALSPSGLQDESLWERFQTARTNRGTSVIETAGGTERVVEYAATPEIESGRHLFVLHDVTDRKKHEEMLTALHGSSRRLLRAETRDEVAENVVDAVADLLPVSTAAVFVFDEADGVLRPAAATEDADAALSETPVAPSRNSAVGTAFLDETFQLTEGLAALTGVQQPAAFSRSWICLPMGAYGVCVFGDADPKGPSDNQELMEILVAAAETAIDRIEKESELRARETELQAQNRKLRQLNRLNRIVREIDKNVVTANTRAEIEKVVCHHLAQIDGISYVWISDYESHQKRLHPRYWEGDSEGQEYLESVSFAEDSQEPAMRAATTSTPVSVANVARDIRSEEWRNLALDAGFHSVLSIPIVYKQFVYGTITLYAEPPHFFDDLPESALSELGNHMGRFVNSVEHQNAVLSESATELVFRFHDESFLLYSVAVETDCSLEFRGFNVNSDGVLAAYLSVDGADVQTVAAAIDRLPVVTGTTVIAENGRRGSIECSVCETLLLGNLAERGVWVKDLSATPEYGTLALGVPSTVDVRWVVEKIQDQFTNADLVSKREGPRVDSTPHAIAETFRSKLTDRQEEVLQLAYKNGYFQSPRDCTGEELATALDISPQSFYRHIRNAERKLYDTVFGADDQETHN